MSERLIALAKKCGAYLCPPEGHHLTGDLLINGSQLEAFATALSKPHASEQGAAPEGWKLVPVQPTEDMLFKMAECDGYQRGDRDHPGLTRWEDYWVMALEAAPHAPAPVQAAPTEPSEGQIEEWRDKAADYDRLAGIARNRRRVLEEIAGSKPLTSTPQQFADHLKRLATKACKDYTFDGNESAAAGEQEKATEGVWISVEDRQPEEGTEVICYAGFTPYLAYLVWGTLDGRCVQTWTHEGETEQQPTHWMPLPAAPFSQAAKGAT